MRTTSWIAATVAVLSAAALAEDITLKTGIPIANVMILDVKSGRITFRVQGGSTVTKALSDIRKISLRQAEAFNKAEELMTAAKPDAPAAVKAYDAVPTENAEEWLKPLVRLRRLQALEQAGIIDRAVSEWLTLMDEDNASPSAVRLRPQKPAEKDSPRNAKAIQLLEAKLQAVAKKKDYAEAVQRELMALYQVEGNTARADELANLLAGKAVVASRPKPASGDGGETVAPAMRDDALGKQLEADRTLIRPGQTPANLEAALRRIRANLKQYDEAQLCEALLAAGKAQALLAGGLAPDERRKALLVAGLDLMSVVAYYPAAPEAGEALVEAADVNAQLGNVQAARAAYQEALSKYADNKPLADRARKGLQDLQGK